MPGPGKRFQKGKAGGPGRPKILPTGKLTVKEYDLILSQVKFMNVDQLLELRASRTEPWEKVCIASIAVNAIKTGDYSAYDALLSRTIGKPKEIKEITVIDEARISMIKQKREILKSILEERKKERPAEYLAEGLLIEKKE